jgi:RHS repeat-associated protein
VNPNTPAATLKLKELHLYGSSRLGMFKPDFTVFPVPGAGVNIGTNYINKKQYELTNHLGNVLAVVTDNRTAVDSDGNGQPNYYEAVVVEAREYYPFGMVMPNRKTPAAGNSAYRYGFNGKENDDEAYGDDNQINFEARIADPRIGRLLSLDPKSNKYPAWSPYAYGFNSPITVVDIDGQENIVVVGAQFDRSSGNKLMFVLQGIRQLKQNIKSDANESNSFVLFTNQYTPDQLKIIQETVEKYGANFIPVSNSDDLVSFINTRSTETLAMSASRNEDLITNIDIFAHGVVGSIEFGYSMANQDAMRFDEGHAKKLDPQAFSKHAEISSYACRTALGNSNIDQIALPTEDLMEENSLAQKIADASKATVWAFYKRTDYSNTLSTSLERKLLKLDGYLDDKRQYVVDRVKEVEQSRDTKNQATFDPNGALHPVTSGNTPLGVPSGKHMFKPKDEK